MPECLIIDRQTDRRYKSVLLLYLFIYSVIQYKTAGGGDSQKGCNAFSWIPVPGGLLRVSYVATATTETEQSGVEVRCGFG